MTNTVVTWQGEDQKQWQAEFGIENGVPCVRELRYQLNGKTYVLCQMLRPQFRVVTAKRTKRNPQRKKALAPGEELGYQWDTYSDNPMANRAEVKEANS